MFLRNIGPFELLILLFIVILIFGGKRLGELGGSLGKAIRDFRQELSKPDNDEEKTGKDGE